MSILRSENPKQESIALTVLVHANLKISAASQYPGRECVCEVTGRVLVLACSTGRSMTSMRSNPKRKRIL